MSYWESSAVTITESKLCEYSRVIIDYLLTGKSSNVWLTKYIPSPDCLYMDYRCTRLLSDWLTSTRTTCIKRSKHLFYVPEQKHMYLWTTCWKLWIYGWHVTKQHGGSLLNVACWNAELLSLYSLVSTNQLIELLTELWRANPNLFK